MELEKYVNINSIIHSCEPRLKFLSLVFLVIISAIIKKPISMIAIGSLSILLILISRIPVTYIIKSIKIPLYFLLFMLIILCFTSGGNIIYSFGIFNLYREGIILALQILVRSISIMIIILILFSSTKMNTIMNVMQSLKFPVILVNIIYFTYRFIFLYSGDIKQLFISAKLRGSNTIKGIRNIQSTVSIFVTLLIKSYEQSERIFASMKLRGFTGDFHSFVQFKPRFIDIVKLSIIITAGAGIVLFEVLL